MINFLLLILIAYLIGSLPTSLLIGKIFYKKDIRTIGSGNAGATNTLRNFGMIPGLVVLIMDFLKGFIACNLSQQTEIQFFLLFSVIIGHVYSVFSKFKGGKGASTTLGCFFGLNPLFILIPISVYLLVFLKTKISSISSIFSIFSLTASGLLFNNDIIISLMIILVCPLILWTHRENIDRIMEGKEKKLF